MSALYDFYTSLFETVIVDTDELLQECYRVRHIVYSEEMGTEPTTASRSESDEFDAHAVHALLRYKQTQQFVGTVRLILQKKGSGFALPVYKICADNNLVLPEAVSPDRIGEISRFCIIKSFRRRVADTGVVGSAAEGRDLEVSQARVIPSMSLGLLGAAYQLAKRNDVEQYFCIMEPYLHKLLAKLGLHLEPMGPLVEHHGMRQVCHATLAGLHARLIQEHPDVWEVISDKGKYA